MFDDLDPLAPPVPEGSFELDIPARESVAPQPVEVSDEDARALAGFGSTPDGALAAARYAWNARSRRRALAAEVSSARERLTELEKTGRVMRLSWMRQNTASPSRDEEAGPDPVRDALVAEAAAAADGLAPWTRRADKVRTQLEVWEHDVKRAKAALQRLEIEMRGAGGDPAARAPFMADHATRTSALALAIERRDNERAELDETLEEVGRRTDVARGLAASLRAHDQERRAKTAELRDAGTAEEARLVAEANRQLREGEGGALALPVLSHAKREHDAARALALASMAWRTLDAEAYERGAEVIGAVVFAVGLGLLLTALV